MQRCMHILQDIHMERAHSELARNLLRFCIAHILNNTPILVTDKVQTNSFHGFSTYTKQYMLSKYSAVCNIANCYVCNS